MHISRRLFLSLALVPCLAFTTAQASDNDDDDDNDNRKAVGAVYTMSNAVDGNRVLMFNRGRDGTLSTGDKYATGGLGSGGGLGNQGGLALSENGRRLFAVNAGSNEISAFAVRRNGLVLLDTVDSGGTQPVSVTVDGNLLYVLNAGSDSIAGFTLGRRGRLEPLPGSTRPLSTSGTGPAQIAFNPDGEVLVVTEKATNRIDTYRVDEDGLPTDHVVHDSEGPTPFGFAFDRRGRLVVAEAAGGSFEASSVSSYDLEEDGELEAISAAVPTTETAACWVVITRNGRFAYTTNTGSGSVSGYRIGRDGSLSLLDPDGRSGETGAGSAPIDMAFSRNSRYLYTLNARSNTLSAFRVGANGALQAIPGVNDLPAGTNGLVAR